MNDVTLAERVLGAAPALEVGEYAVVGLSAVKDFTAGTSCKATAAWTLWAVTQSASEVSAYLVQRRVGEVVVFAAPACLLHAFSGGERTSGE